MGVRLGTEEWPRGAPGSAHGAGWAASPRSFPGAHVPPTPPGHRGARAAARQPASSAAWARAGCFAVCASVSPSQNESDARIYRLSLKVERAHSAPVAWSCAAYTHGLLHLLGAPRAHSRVASVTLVLCAFLQGRTPALGGQAVCPRPPSWKGTKGPWNPYPWNPKVTTFYHLIRSPKVTGQPCLLVHVKGHSPGHCTSTGREDPGFCFRFWF